MSSSSPPFTFLDPGPLVDGDLTLVTPGAEWLDDVLRSCSHPDTVADAQVYATMTRGKLLDFLKTAPCGRQPGDPTTGRIPVYHYWMLADPAVGPAPALRIVGGIGLRIGSTPEIDLYSGNVGYHVYPAARGRHFAERACRLLLPLARAHGMQRLWITCNPDNLASRRTCERLGATLVDVVPIPKDHPFRTRGETAKCRFLVQLNDLPRPA